jgi:hypothetical protein
VAVQGDYAYVAIRRSGLEVIDIADPANPQIVGSVDTPGYSVGVAVLDSHAYLADRSAGMQVIDVTDPAEPKLVGSLDTPGEVYSVALAGDYGYIADWDCGLHVVPLQCDPLAGYIGDDRPASGSLLRLHPNPVSGRALIHFETSSAGPVQAIVYDIIGRSVRSIFDGRLNPGTHSLHWDGLNSAGETVSSGVYLIRISKPGGTVAGRLVLVR